MARKKIILAIVLLSAAVLVGWVAQPLFPQSNLFLQLTTKKAVQRASEQIPLLLDDNLEVREQAFQELQALGINASLLALVRALKNQDWQIRTIAAYTLGRFGTEANPAISDLSAAIKDENADVRLAVAQALGNIGSEKGVPALIQALQDKDENVRVSAATALSKLGTKAQPASSALTKALWDGNWFVRRQASETLSVLGLDSVNIPLMVDPLEEIQQTRDGGIISLVTAIDPSVLDRPESISHFFIQALQNQDPKIRQSAASALGQIQTTRFATSGGQESRKALFLALKDRDSNVQISAIQALSGTYNHFSLEEKLKYLKNIIEFRSALLKFINEKSEIQVRVRSLKALEETLYFGYLKPQPLVAKQITFAAIKSLTEEDIQVRQNALELLHRVISIDLSSSLKNEIEAIIYPNILEFIDNKSEYIDLRLKAFQILSNRQDFQIGDWLTRKDLDIEIRRSLILSASAEEIQTLTQSEQGLAILNSLLQDEEFGVQIDTAISIYKAGVLNIALYSEFISLLSEGLLSKDSVIKFDSISGIGEFIGFQSLDKFEPEVSAKLRAQIPILTNCLNSPKKPMRYAAALTINQIEPSQEYTIPIFREMLAEETDVRFRHYAARPTLVKIDSPQAALAIAENAQLENQEIKYIRSCATGYIQLPSKHQALLVKLLRDENLRQILAQSIHHFSSDESLESEYGAATVDALIALLNKENAKPALQPALELKNQDIRRSAAYALGRLLSYNQEPGLANRKIIEALTAVVDDSDDNLDIRWMAATSLQESDINMDDFFSDNNLINPKTFQCPYSNLGGGVGGREGLG